jgi:hypothetical protein
MSIFCPATICWQFDTFETVSNFVTGGGDPTVFDTVTLIVYSPTLEKVGAKVDVDDVDGVAVPGGETDH